MATNLKRDITLDLACGILIIRMVLKHALQWAQVTHYDFYEWINVFFFIMPWFFFKSGMFYKDKPLYEVLSTGFKHLIVPLLIMTLVGHLIICVNYIIEGGHRINDFLIEPFQEILRFGSAQGNLSLWFLLSLFLVRLFYHLLSKAFNPVHIFFISMVVTLMTLHLPIKEPYYLKSSMAGLFFFSLGQLLKDIQYNKYIFLLSVVIYFVHTCVLPSYVDMRSCELLEGYYEIWMVGAIGGCIFLNVICKWAVMYGTRLGQKFKQIRYLSFLPDTVIAIGKNSLVIYLFHWIFLMSFSLFLYDLPYFNGKHRWEYFAMSGLFTIAGLYLVYRYRQSKVVKFLMRS